MKPNGWVGAKLPACTSLFIYKGEGRSRKKDTALLISTPKYLPVVSKHVLLCDQDVLFRN